MKKQWLNWYKTTSGIELTTLSWLLVAMAILIGFMGPFLTSAWLIKAALIGCSILTIIAGQLEIPLSNTRYLDRFAQTAKKADYRFNPAIGLGTLICLNGLAIWAPFYVSDDVVRHIHDGFYMLQGVDVYRTPPNNLAQLIEIPPNHPELGTIYLPTTQLLGLLGALLSRRYGFLLLYHGLIIILIIWTYISVPKKFFLRITTLLLSVWLLFAMQGHHADYLGLWIVLALICQTRPGHHLKSGLLRNTMAIGYGSMCVLLIGLKPEGSLWCLYLLYVAWQRNTNASMLGILAGCLMAAGLLGWFASSYMWPNQASLEAFIATGQTFTEWFIAYNPFPALMMVLFDLSIPASLDLWRKTMLFVCILSVLILGLIIYVQKLESRKVTALSGYRRGRLFKNRTGLLLLIALLFFILHKGTWNPWYFSWLVPLAVTFRIKKWQNWLLACMPLFYLPVVDLRINGAWSMMEFTSIVAGFWVFVVLYQIFYKQQNSMVGQSLPGKIRGDKAGNGK